MSISIRTLLFAGYGLLVALANAPVLGALVEVSRNEPSASHALLIPFVTLALIYHRRTPIFSTVRFAWPAGLGVILAGLALWVGVSLGGWPEGQDDALACRVGALVVLWFGGFLLLYGRDAFRAALFPLLFLGFMIPIPGVLLDGATALLKSGTAESTAGLFSVTGTPYHRQEFVFHLPSVVIEIADACSGIRSSIALLLTSLLVGYTYLRNPWTRSLLVLAIVPVTILKNGIRIVSLSLLAIHVDPAFLDGRLHHDGGIVFFLLSLLMLQPLLVLLRNSETSLQAQRT